MTWKSRVELLRDQLERQEGTARSMIAILREQHAAEMKKLSADDEYERAVIRGFMADMERRTDAHISSIEKQLVDLQYEGMRERTELKKIHAEELNRVIEENQRLRDDAERYRILLSPGLQHAETVRERNAPPPPVTPFAGGTPWQRILAREIAAQDEAAAKKFTKPADAPLPGDKKDGSTSEGRVDAPQRGEGKPA